MKEKGVFQGFSKNTIRFLTELKQNNNKAWFEANRMRYQEYLVKPLVELVTDLSGLMLSFDQYIEVSPVVSKTISRIYRDTRFSSDKSPFRNTMWITFKRPRNDWVDAPAYFFEISSESYRYGMGFYSAGKKTMDRLRQRISDNPTGFSKVIPFYSMQRIFVVEGEKYKRVLNRNIPQELIDWYQRKNLYLVCNRKIDEHLFSRKLVGDLEQGFSLLAPFYHYLWRLKEGTK